MPDEVTSQALLPTETFNEESQIQSTPSQGNQSAQAQVELPQQQEETPQPTADQNSSNNTGTPVKSTRAGRTVKTPDRYKDFVKLA